MVKNQESWYKSKRMNNEMLEIMAERVVNMDVVNKDLSKELIEETKPMFHKTVTQTLFLSERGRPDILPIMLAMCTRVKLLGHKDRRNCCIQ